MHDVLIPTHFAAEIEAIGEWIARDNPLAARRMMERIYRRCLSPDLFPERGRPYGATWRAIDEGRHVIIYRVESPARVVIVAVLHGSRDIRRILRLPGSG